MNEEIMNVIRTFVKERDWEKFHTGENLAKSICIESGELLELFQWEPEPKSMERVKEEIADVLIYALMFCDHYGIDPEKAILEKEKKNAEKYPVCLCKGSAEKYDELKK